MMLQETSICKERCWQQLSFNNRKIRFFPHLQRDFRDVDESSVFNEPVQILWQKIKNKKKYESGVQSNNSKEI